jgi:hypothetical protein
MIGLLALYGAVFAVLVTIQFTKQGEFTLKVGDFVVTGQYRLPGAAGSPPAAPNERLLDETASVFFGGMEFSMNREDAKFSFIKSDKTREETFPESMVLSGESAVFRISGGTELNFSSQFVGGKPELRIDANFGPDIEVLELPYKPLKKSSLRDSGDGQFIVISDGVNYSFGRAAVDQERRTLILRAGGAAVSYRVVPEKKAFAPEDFTLPAALAKQSFDEALRRWRDQSFSLWNRIVSESGDEDLIIAYVGEAVRRGTYKAAVSAVPGAFLNGGQRTYVSSAYLGRMDLAFRSFTTLEREKISRLSRMINEKSRDFLKDSHVFEYFAVRGYVNFVDDGAELVRSMDPAALTIDLAPGILEGFSDWKIHRPYTDNPFERLVDQACFVISEGIKKTSEEDKVLVFHGGEADSAFNLRLGKALLNYAEKVNAVPWAAVARSLILSVLALADNAGTVPGSLLLSESGAITENASLPRLSSARLYRILAPGEYFPRAVGIGAAINSIWTWTAASAISASQENTVLDISVSFPVGETHYMMIRGIKPFAKIQLYNIDYRTDPQFERYDSSGWTYSQAEQTLILKMKHRAAVEHIRIFYSY